MTVYSHLDGLEILVDSIGLGSGVVDRLREIGLPVRGVNVAEAPSMGETYLNLRSGLWFKTKAWFEDRACKLPKDDQLVAELTQVFGIVLRLVAR